MSTQLVSKKPPITSWIKETMSKKYILIIEPHPAIAEVLVSILYLSQYDCSLVSSMDITSSLWKNHQIDIPPSSILLDIDIGTISFQSPFDFVSAFCRQWQHAFFAVPMPPLILLTTHPGNGEALQQAGHSVVMKPFKSSVLMSQIEGAAEQAPQAGLHRADPTGRKSYD